MKKVFPFLLFVGLFLNSCQKEDPPTIPVIFTTPAYNITATSATTGGGIINDGGSDITANGVCWGTTLNPSITDTRTIDAIGSAQFVSDLSELTSGAIYHVRAYATNSVGTAYGADVQFKTLLVDYEGNEYKTIKIGDQLWMAENLKSTSYNDGTLIPFINDNAVWSDLRAPGYCWYDNNIEYRGDYGAYYNWFVVDATSNGNKNVCPLGWHVPAISDWETLINFLGGTNIAGGKIKEAGILNWTTPNTGATNTSGFTALPSGNRAIHGWYADMHRKGYFWSSSEYDDLNAWFFSLANTTADALMVNSWKRLGFPIRCLKD